MHLSQNRQALNSPICADVPLRNYSSVRRTLVVRVTDRWHGTVGHTVWMIASVDNVSHQYCCCWSYRFVFGREKGYVTSNILALEAVSVIRGTAVSATMCNDSSNIFCWIIEWRPWHTNLQEVCMLHLVRRTLVVRVTDRWHGTVGLTVRMMCSVDNVSHQWRCCVVLQIRLRPQNGILLPTYFHTIVKH